MTTTRSTNLHETLTIGREKLGLELRSATENAPQSMACEVIDHLHPDEATERLAFVGSLDDCISYVRGAVYYYEREQHRTALHDSYKEECECPGHESTAGPMGITDYCDGSCLKGF
jgi:hypothetical protein